MEQISKTLYNGGCSTFFVATIEEGQRLRALLPGAQIYILNGLMEDTEEFFINHQMIPVLNDLDQVQRWNRYGEKSQLPPPAAIHFDTGIARLGLPPDETNVLLKTPEIYRHIDLTLILSHLACSDLSNHPFNPVQLQRFQKIASHFPRVRKSFANSRGLFIHPDYHFDLVRLGKSLYGLGLDESCGKNLKPIVSIYARILQVRGVKKGETIGYESTFRATPDMKIATLAMGFADGWIRALSNRGSVHFDRFPAPIVGLISMDLMTVDVTDIPENLSRPGQWAEVVGPHIHVDDVAKKAGTTSRELLCHLSDRYLTKYNEV